MPRASTVSSAASTWAASRPRRARRRAPRRPARQPSAPAAPASAPQQSAPQRSVPEQVVQQPPPSSLPEAPAEPQGAPAGRGEPLPAAGRTPGGIDTAAIRRSWPDVLAKIFALKRATWTFLSEHAQVVDYDGERLLLGISTVGLANTFRRGQHAEYVRQALIDVLGLDVLVEGVPTDEAQASAAGTGTSAGAPERPAPRDSRASRPAAAPATSPARAGSVAGPPAARPGGAPADGASPGRAAARAAGRPGPAAYADVPEPDDEPPPDDDPGPRVVDDTAASIDDEDIAELGEVGLPVVQRILGATVIDDGAP